MYALPALNLNVEQIREFNVAWNNIFRHIFGFQRWESVRQFMSGIGRTNFRTMFIYGYLVFVKSSMSSCNAKFRFLMLRHYLSNMNTFMNRHNFTMDLNFEYTTVSQLRHIVANVFHVNANPA